MLPDGDIAAQLRARARDRVGAHVRCSRARVEQLLFGAPSSLVSIAGAQFRVQGRLGAGGMGAVYEVEHDDSPGRLALKVLHSAGSEEAYRLKREFRTLAQVAHPNLVTLHALFADAEGCAFTMELLRGRDFVSYVRPHGAPDFTLLRAATRQLVEGVAALHEAGIIHRDLKPSNVLVDDTGRVALLDFGVALEGAEHEVSGTLAFMPEEQRRGRTVPASDFHALGVMLSLAITGQLEPSDAIDARGEAGAWLELASCLKHPDPSARPDADAVLSFLEGSRARRRTERVERPRYVGREAQRVHVLRACAEPVHEPRLLLVEGASGMGKTMLLDEALRSLAAQAPEVLVLRGTCSRREAVRYRALDPWIDALSSVWKDMSAEDAAALVPQGAAALVELFPVLARVPEVAARAAEEPTMVDARERRRVAIAALRSVLSRLAARRKLLLSVDDVHWIDTDSLELLGEIVRMPGAPPVMLLAGTRPDAREHDASLWTRFARRERVVLEALSPEDAHALVRTRLPERPQLWDAIVQRGEGSPFLLGELCELARAHDDEHGALRLESVLDQRLSSLGALPRKVLELVALAGEPLEPDVLAETTGHGTVDVLHALTLLEAKRYVRSPSEHTRGREPYHDRIRELVRGALGPDVTRHRHRSLATALERRGGPGRARLLLHHYRECGENELAARHARTAAEEAAQRLAFHDAASLYATCLELVPHHPERPALLGLQADMLDSAGRDREAAAVVAELAREAEGSRRDELTRREVELLLRGGFMEDGMARVDAMLAAFGLRRPRTLVGSLANLAHLRTRLGLRGLRTAQRPDPDPKRLARIDACLTVSRGAGVRHVLLGIELTTRALLDALEAGEPTRLARALTAEAITRSIFDDPRPHAEALALAAEIAASTKDPQIETELWFHASQCAFLRCDFRAVNERAARTIELLRTRCRTSASNHAVARYVWFSGRLANGDTTLLPEVIESMRDAAERGDRGNEMNHRTGFAGLHLMRDRPDECRAQVDVMSGLWNEPGYESERWTHALVHAQADLYEGDAARALARTDEALRGIRQTGFMRVPFTRILTIYWLAVTTARARGLEARSVLKRLGRRLEREPFALGHLLGLQLGACVTALHGDRALAAARMRELAPRLEACGAAWYARATWLMAHDLAGDAESARAHVRALQDLGVAEPRRYLSAWMPLAGGEDSR